MSNRFNRKAPESRFLAFTDDDTYAAVYGAILNNNRGFGRVEVRVIGKILDKLEAIGTQEEVAGKGIDYKLKTDNEVVELTEPEYRLIDECIGDVKWRGTFVRQAAKLLDWFDNAPTSDPRNEVLPDVGTNNEPQVP